MNCVRLTGCLLVSTFGLNACGPTVLLRTHTDGAYRRIEVLQHRGKQYVQLDGRPGPRVDAVSIAALTISADGSRIAYPAKIGRQWAVVVDDSVRAPWDGIAMLKFSPTGTVVHAAEHAGRWCVVQADACGPPFDAILQGSLKLTPAGRLAYVAADGDAFRAVIDGVPGAPFDGIGGLQFDREGKRVAYVARSGNRAMLVGDDWSTRAYDAISELAWPSGRERPAYTARDSSGWHVIMGDASHGPFEAVGSIRFSNDGEFWAFLSRAGGADRMVTPSGFGHTHSMILPASVSVGAGGRLAYVVRTPAGEAAVVDEIIGPTFSTIRDLAFSQDGRHVAYIAGDSAGERVVLDGAATVPYSTVSDLTVRAGRAAFVAHTQDGSRVVLDGTEHRFDAVASGSLVFSEDGAHWAVFVGNRGERRLALVVDGVRTSVRFDWREYIARLWLIPAHQNYSTESQRILRSWIRTQLRRLTAPS